MKKIYTIVTVLVASMTFAQNNISFEASEGFALGSIHGQNGWEATELNGSPLTNQFITNEFASNGTYSFKNAHLPEKGGLFAPIIGGIKTFASPLDYKNTTISYDVRATQKGKSDFEFSAYHAVDANYSDMLFAVGLEASGKIFVISDKFDFNYTTKDWDVNRWYNITIKTTADKISFLVDNEQVYEIPNRTKANIDLINILHNNYGGDAYYDNFKINDKDLATYEATASKALTVYPNPAKDVVTIASDEKITAYSIYNIVGQKVKSGTSTESIDIKSLSTGNYILQAKTENGKTLSTKLIKN